jgi:hypothetical protein
MGWAKWFCFKPSKPNYPELYRSNGWRLYRNLRCRRMYFNSFNNSGHQYANRTDL